MEARLREIEQTSKDVFLLTARLSKSPGPAAYHADQIALIREALQTLEREIAYVETFAEDEDDSVLRARQKLHVKRFSEDVVTHRILFRRAVVQSRKNLDLAERQALETQIEKTRLGTVAETQPTSTSRTRRDENSSNAVLQASSDVTAELRRTHALMSEELSKSALSRELLAESSTTLAKLGQEYSTFGIVLNGSKRLLKELERADRADQVWIGGSFIFFILVSAYVVYKRVLARPVKAVLWTGSFMFSALNRNKIVAKHSPQAIQEAQGVEMVNPLMQPGPPIEKSGLDEVVDLVLPEFIDYPDQAAVMRKAEVPRAVRHEDHIDIIHAEL